MKKQHQHFIPQVYLKNFAHTRKGKTHLLAAYDILQGKMFENMSIVDICTETDLYTLKHLKGDDKYDIENFFSHNVESEYHKVYNLLVKEKKKHITPDERMFILYTTLSMYFRTPKVLNKFVDFTANLIENVKSDNNAKTIDFLGYKIPIEGKSFDELKKEIKETNRIDFLKAQFALLNEFVTFKAYDGLVVIELVGEQEFITSDNPVEIRSHDNNDFNLFDASNSIYIPLDFKHALFIAPRQEKSIVNLVYYLRDNFFEHVILNKSTFKNSERWIIGTKKGIENFLMDLEKYSKPADDNHPIIIKFKKKIELIKTLSELANKGISNDNKDLIEFMKKLRQHELYNESPDFQDTYNKMKQTGLNI